MERAEEILYFWFGDIDEETKLTESPDAELWFAVNKDFDKEIKENFEDDVMKAASGDYRSWERDMHGRLALILLFDQFPRNIYRGHEDAYEYDLKALEQCLRLIRENNDTNLSLVERQFAYMPMMHSENIEVQRRSLEYYQELLDEAKDTDPENVDYYEKVYDFANQHYEIVKEFNRFPHRNKILKRRSTSSENIFVQQQTEYAFG